MTKLLWLLPLSFLLTACPFESNMPLEKAPVEPVDSSLLGFWYGIVKDGSDYFGIEALEISRQSDSLYSVIRYGKAVKGDIANVFLERSLKLCVPGGSVSFVMP